MSNVFIKIDNYECYIGDYYTDSNGNVKCHVVINGVYTHVEAISIATSLAKKLDSRHVELHKIRETRRVPKYGIVILDTPYYKIEEYT